VAAQEPADFAAAAAEAEADTVDADFDVELSVVADFVAEPVDEDDSSFVGELSVLSGEAVPCDAEVAGAAVVGGVVVGEEVLALGDALGLVDGDTVAVGVGFVVGLVVGGVVGRVVGLVVGFGLVWSLGWSGSGEPRFGPSTVPSIEP
jgi:hypothetical protein